MIGSDQTRRHGPERSCERGVALITALLIMVIMTLLGIPFLLMGETENRIAENEKLSLQALYVAEAGALIAQRWFEQPGDPTNIMNPPLAAIERSQRLLNKDGAPLTAPEPADAADPDLPLYKQFTDELFQAPYRGSFADTLLGTQDGPDMRIDDGTVAGKAFLVELSSRLLGSFPSASTSRRARINRIDVYEPPYALSGGEWTRLGVATVKVTARIYQEQPGSGERVLAERMVKLVLNEVPYTQGIVGPVHSCGDFIFPDDDGPMRVRWGILHVAGNLDPTSDPRQMPVGLPRVAATSPGVDPLWATDDDVKWNAYYQKVSDEELPIMDPWFRMVVGGTIVGAENTNPVPWRFDWDPDELFEDGDLPYHGVADPIDDPDDPYPDMLGTRSNYTQLDDPGSVSCPQYSYLRWKEFALEGGSNIHYYAHYSGETFKENGDSTNPAVTVDVATDQQTGFFFFDTDDGNPPEPDGSNLTPEIKLSDVPWRFKGMIYLNTLEFRVDDTDKELLPIAPPGEPFQDKNENGRFDAATENYVNLEYPGDVDGTFKIEPNSPVYNVRGPVITNKKVNFSGVLYNSGQIDSTGAVIYYGAVVAGKGFAPLGTDLLSVDRPTFIWDQGLLENWPPDAYGLPRYCCNLLMPIQTSSLSIDFKKLI